MPEERMLKPGEELYIGCKIIRAYPMDECTFLAQRKGQDVSNRDTRDGYHVMYPDGYESWSPKKTFETAYRRVTLEEQGLL
jgi:hypothetical protein